MSRLSFSIATRRSPLALWQAEHVAACLKKVYVDSDITLLPMNTTGDQAHADGVRPLGYKGLFVDTLEQALREGRANIAVHSLKDVPAMLTQDMLLAACLCRENPHDAFIARVDSVMDLPLGARVGTASARRHFQLRHVRPDLDVRVLRGNVGTRLRAFTSGDFDAILLSACGLERLQLNVHYTIIPFQLCLPAAGQGGMAVTCLRADEKIARALRAINHASSEHAATAERLVVAGLGGGCTLPLAVFADVQGEHVHVRARAGSADGRVVLEAEQSGFLSGIPSIADQLVQDLKQQGVMRFLVPGCS